MTELPGKKSPSYANIMSSAYEHLASIGDPLSHIVRSIGVLEFNPDPEIFRNVCESIICQQLSSRVADVILKRVYAAIPDGGDVAEEYTGYRLCRFSRMWDFLQEN
ncbi:MAG: hypothetical protein M1463_03615 [Candidatus Thermoplasmatota archaeon]|nr:hypothetical protein [Candidatus Thermoplasmatota archaeon]